MVVDTGVFIDHLRAKEKFSMLLYRISDNVPLYISAVTRYELHMGATSPVRLHE